MHEKKDRIVEGLEKSRCSSRYPPALPSPTSSSVTLSNASVPSLFILVLPIAASSFFSFIGLF